MNDAEQWTRTWGSDRLVALCRDPHTLWVYWELRDRRKQLIAHHFAKEFVALPLYLRTCDVTDIDYTGDNAHATHYKAISPFVDNAYLYDLTPGRVYLVDFGTLLPTGNFFTVLRSQPIETPRVARTESETAVVHARFLRLGEVSAHMPISPVAVADDRPPGTIPYEESFDGYSDTKGRVSR